MASELITGFAGTPHVGSDDMGAFQAGILGTGSYVLQTGQQLKATVASANKVTIGTGDLVMNGRHVRMATATDLTIQNGTQGQKRNDLIVCRYSKASDGKETAALTVVKGTATTGTPADPSYNKTSILDGATTSDMPLYRIPITNLSVGTPVQLFKVLTPLDTVGDSVTPTDWQLIQARRPTRCGCAPSAGSSSSMSMRNTPLATPGVVVRSARCRRDCARTRRSTSRGAAGTRPASARSSSKPTARSNTTTEAARRTPVAGKWTAAGSPPSWRPCTRRGTRWRGSLRRRTGC